jgi:hypothetical protein
MKIVSKKEIGVASVFILAFAFFFDANLFGYRPRDPVTGRHAGCYTMIEDLLGVQRPTGWIRDAEMWASLILFVLGVVAAVLAWWSDKRRKMS